MNLLIYNIGILGTHEFNMFFISPYFVTTLPVFDFLQTKLPYILYLFSYICILMIGGLLIYIIAYLIELINKRLKKKDGCQG